MPGGALDMADVLRILEVTDAFGIDREQVSIELGREDPGAVRKSPGGALEIVAPESVPLDAWMPALREKLKELGYEEG